MNAVFLQVRIFFVTTRAEKMVRWIGYADYYQVKILYGTDKPIFK